ILKGRKLYLYKSRYNYIIRRPKGLGGRFLLANIRKEIEKTRGGSIKGNRP
ncbi:hypothetical protein V8E51_016421, partial [Hyaloscypha variabilis]